MFPSKSGVNLFNPTLSFGISLDHGTFPVLRLITTLSFVLPAATHILAKNLKFLISLKRPTRTGLEKVKSGLTSQMTMSARSVTGIFLILPLTVTALSTLFSL